MNFWTGVTVVAAMAALAFYLRTREQLKGLAFTAWIFAFVAAAMFFPVLFIQWGGFKMTGLIVPLIQIIMFGMGTGMSVSDFANVVKMPRGVFVGVFLHFFVMPILGVTLTRVFGFQGEVAAGVILIGSCPAGVASNVINYLAGSNVPLSVTMTAASTMVSPFLTPFLMKVLAGAYVPIDFTHMMIEIFKLIIIPIGGGLLANKLLRGKAAILQKFLPLVSMGAICFIIAIITASSREKLLQVGALLIIAGILHNNLGYFFGYLLSRLLRLNVRDSRTVAIEVGMQNAGMATGLAINVLKSTDAGLAAAIFGPVMNISGSAVASVWRRRPAK